MKNIEQLKPDFFRYIETSEHDVILAFKRQGSSIDGEPIYRVGWAARSEEDRVDKKKGRLIATGRLNCQRVVNRPRNVLFIHIGDRPFVLEGIEALLKAGCFKSKHLYWTVCELENLLVSEQEATKSHFEVPTSEEKPF